MAERFKYEKPVLVDMASGSALGDSGLCDGGSCVGECALGSCIPTAVCQNGEYTGYCENGFGACSYSSMCYICCAEGYSAGWFGSGQGQTGSCSCAAGGAAAWLCYSGSRVSSICLSGGTAYEECNGGCA